MTSRVFLTGMMGSGKSSTGRILAEALGFDFVDLDRRIEHEHGLTISELFDQGEVRFRELEAAALQRVALSEHVVVATGGGTLIPDEAMELGRSVGVVVYLRAPPALLARRLQASRDRPLLLQAGRPLTPAALHRRIDGLLEERAAAYMRADIVVDVADKSPDDLAREVLAALGHHLDNRNDRR